MQEEALQGNENIEQAIAALQQNATPELLAHALTAIRRRARPRPDGYPPPHPGKRPVCGSRGAQSRHHPDEPKSRADPRRPRLVVRLYQL